MKASKMKQSNENDGRGGSTHSTTTLGVGGAKIHPTAISEGGEERHKRSPDKGTGW